MWEVCTCLQKQVSRTTLAVPLWRWLCFRNIVGLLLDGFQPSGRSITLGNVTLVLCPRFKGSILRVRVAHGRLSLRVTEVGDV